MLYEDVKLFLSNRIDIKYIGFFRGILSDFDTIQSLLESTLYGLLKEALIVDGTPMYPKIIDQIGIKHQLCVFHIIKNHHTNSFKMIARVSRRINTI